jgi:uncharacterized protein (DUF302 family)
MILGEAGVVQPTQTLLEYHYFYYFSEIVDTSFESAIAQVTELLKQEGVCFSTEIDVKATFK